MDGVNQSTVGVCILGTDGKDLFPWSCVFWHSHVIDGFQEHGPRLVYIYYLNVGLKDNPRKAFYWITLMLNAINMLSAQCMKDLTCSLIPECL